MRCSTGYLAGEDSGQPNEFTSFGDFRFRSKAEQTAVCREKFELIGLVSDPSERAGTPAPECKLWHHLRSVPMRTPGENPNRPISGIVFDSESPAV